MIIPNTTGAIAFVMREDEVKPHIVTAPVIAWKLDEIDGVIDADPVFGFLAMCDDDNVIAHYHKSSNTLESLDLVTSLVFHDEDDGFLESKHYLQSHYEMEVI